MDSYFANEEYCSEDSTLPAEQYTPPPTCSIEETGRWKMESYCHLVDGRWNRTVICKMEDLLMRNCPLEGLLQQQLSVVESVGTGAPFRSKNPLISFLRLQSNRRYGTFSRLPYNIARYSMMIGVIISLNSIPSAKVLRLLYLSIELHKTTAQS